LNLLLVCGGHQGLPTARQLPEQALQQGIITQIVLAVVAADQNFQGQSGVGDCTKYSKLLKIV